MPRGLQGPVNPPPGPARDMVDLLRRLLHASGLDRATVAERADLSLSYLSEMLNGRKTPKPDTADRLAAAMKARNDDRLLARQLAERVQELKRYERAVVRPAALQSRRSDQAPDPWEICMAFVLAIDTAHNLLRSVARDNLTGDDLLTTANSVLQEVDVYAQRERLLSSADPQVVAAGEGLFFALVDVRNAIRTGSTLDSMAYHEVYHPFAEAIWRYRLAMRAAFGQEPLTPQEVHRADWSDRDRCTGCAGSTDDADSAQPRPVERVETRMRVPQPALRDT